MLALLDVSVKSLDQGSDGVFASICLLILLLIRLFAAVLRIRVLLKHIVVK